MKTVVLAAHTDDAEIGVGGTIMNLIADNHEVIIVNMTEKNQVGLDSAAFIGAKPEWLEFETGKVEDCEEGFLKVENFLDQHKPDLIFSHWPVDEHPDHRATGSMAIKYVNNKQQKFINTDGEINQKKSCPQLMFYAPIVGKQAKCFRPDIYVELSELTFEKKKRVMHFYTGDPITEYAKSWYKHEIMTMEFRAREAGACRHSEIDKGIWAEAFISYPNPRGKERIRIPGER